MDSVPLSPEKNHRQTVTTKQVQELSENKLFDLGLEYKKPYLGSNTLAGRNCPDPITFHDQALVPLVIQKPDSTDDTGITIWGVMSHVSLRSYFSERALKALGVFDEEKKESQGHMVKMNGHMLKVFLGYDHFRDINVFGVDAMMALQVELNFDEKTKKFKIVVK